MASVLESLASGLRQAGGIVSPDAAKTLAGEDAEMRAEDRQTALAKLRFDLEQAAREGSPQYQAQMEALKNERAFREAVKGAGGDMSLIAAASMQYGKPEIAERIFTRQEDRASRLQMAEESNKRHLSELQLRLEDKALDRESRERLAKQAEETKKYLAGISSELAKSNQELKKVQFAMKADQQLQGKVRDLGRDLEKANLPQADSVLTDVETALEKSPNIAEYISGPKSLVPDRLAGDEVKFGRQAFQKLFNITLKDRSGAAVTNPELERLKQEFATGVFKTDKQIKEAVAKARGIINKHYASVSASHGPEALKAYNANIRSLGGKVVIDAPEEGSDPLGLGL
jgi:hypothetical protein